MLLTLVEAYEIRAAIRAASNTFVSTQPPSHCDYRIGYRFDDKRAEAVAVFEGRHLRPNDAK